MTGKDRSGIKKSLMRDMSVILSDDEARFEKLAGYLDALPDSFPDLDKYGFALLYVFDRQRQREQDRGSAGITWEHKSMDERKLTAYSIGIATETVDRGKEYALSVFVHEAAHVLTGNEGHTELFGIVLDGLLSRCAEAGLDLERLQYPEQAPETAPEPPRAPGDPEIPGAGQKPAQSL